MRPTRLRIPCHPIQRVLRRLPGGARWGPDLLLRLGARDPRIYIATETHWATWWVGYYVHRYLRDRYPVRLTSATGTFGGCRVHFTSAHLFFGNPNSVHPSAEVVASWWHGSRRTPGFEDYVARLPETSARTRCVVTSCRLVEEELLACGVPREKLVRIPLGVDTALFAPPTPEERLTAREKWRVPPDRFCAASFQRDGEEDPKWVKGPDVLVGALELAAREIPLFVLLSGGARGYVKRELDRAGVPFVHHELGEDAYAEMRELYHAADAYLISSREEGAPLALLEAMAARVPVVATRCGLAPEVIRSGETGILVEQEDAAGLAAGLVRLAQNPEFAARVAAAASGPVRGYDWKEIAREYEERIYRGWVLD